ncbi:hypothetical protein HD554DRAFT_2172688 [Boletus coccyginus]|nr:hypothetical protein HD554DRAFT_2172688 [Boletus coccyginus]
MHRPTSDSINPDAPGDEAAAPDGHHSDLETPEAIRPTEASSNVEDNRELQNDGDIDKHDKHDERQGNFRVDIVNRRCRPQPARLHSPLTNFKLRHRALRRVERLCGCVRHLNIVWMVALRALVPFVVSLPWSRVTLGWSLRVSSSVAAVGPSLQAPSSVGFSCMPTRLSLLAALLARRPNRFVSFASLAARSVLRQFVLWVAQYARWPRRLSACCVRIRHVNGLFVDLLIRRFGFLGYDLKWDGPPCSEKPLSSRLLAVVAWLMQLVDSPTTTSCPPVLVPAFLPSTRLV